MDSLSREAGLEILFASFLHVSELLSLQTASKLTLARFDDANIWKTLLSVLADSTNTQLKKKGKKKGDQSKSRPRGLKSGDRWKAQFIAKFVENVRDISQANSSTFEVEYEVAMKESVRLQCQEIANRVIQSYGLCQSYGGCDHKEFALIFSRLVPSTSVPFKDPLIHQHCSGCSTLIFGGGYVCCCVRSSHVFCSEACARASYHFGHSLRYVTCPHTYCTPRDFTAGCLQCGFLCIVRVAATFRSPPTSFGKGRPLLSPPMTCAAVSPDGTINSTPHTNTNIKTSPYVHHPTRVEFLCLKNQSTLRRKLQSREGRREVMNGLNRNDIAALKEPSTQPPYGRD